MAYFCLLLLAAMELCASPVQAKARKSTTAASIARLIDESLVKVPGADEVCFAPDEPCDIKLIKFIGSASASLDVAIFDLNLDQLAHEILLQSKKVRVRVLVDRRQAQSDHSLVPLLRKGGVQVRYGHQRGIMHNKFAIVDGKILETGSFNYTNGAAFKNNENQVYLANPAIVERYRRRFEALWFAGDVPREGR